MTHSIVQKRKIFEKTKNRRDFSFLCGLKYGNYSLENWELQKELTY